jgi:hypothetical protein
MPAVVRIRQQGVKKREIARHVTCRVDLSKLVAVADTLAHDGSITEDLQKRKPLSERRLTRDLPNAQYRSLAGQTHNVKAKALALADFFKA